MTEEILKFTQEQVGKKEYPGNQGFKDPFLDNLMRRVGFKNGWAWCAIFAEACYSYPTYSGKSKVISMIGDCFSPNAVKTYQNFQIDAKPYFTTGKLIVPGSVVIWEKRKSGKPVKKDIWTLGHAGIVEKVMSDGFISIEGNTNSSGGREGIEVARKKRTYNYDGKEGLCLVGFITPKI